MDAAHEHVELLAGYRSDGRPKHERIPAGLVPEREDEWELLGTPALVWGCAAGDIVRVAIDGTFEVVDRGGNLAVVSYAQRGTTLHEEGADLRQSLAEFGIVEIAPDGRFVVATVPVIVGFERLEAVLTAWSARTGAVWSYGNVYDEQEQPLNWW